MAGELEPLAVARPDTLQAEIDNARAMLAAAKSPATRKAYASDWARFCAFCDARNVEALPARPDIVALFIHVEADAGIAPITLGRRVAAITHHHREVGLTSPSGRDDAGVISGMLAGVRRRYARVKEQKAPAEAEVLKAMLATIEGMGVRARRDRALLALGMAGAFRRSELAALQLQDLQFTNTGLRITIPRSKRDQEGKGQLIAIPEGRFFSPVTLLRHWLHAASLDRPDPVSGKPQQGPVFRRLTRSDVPTGQPITCKTVARLVKTIAAAADLDPALYSAHSLRAGFLTEAAARRANLVKMKDHSFHKSLGTVAEYVRDAAIFDDHAGDGFL